MRADEFLTPYTQDGLLRLLVEKASSVPVKTIHLKGLNGSLDTVLLAAMQRQKPCHHLVILRDKEEAGYFMNDLQSLLGEDDILFFPASYKQVYTFSEVENANVCMRSETLSRLMQSSRPHIVVTYPEALGEKVVTKKTLSNNMFWVEQGGPLDGERLQSFLHTHDFERVDFVSRAGQYAIRGGIFDVFSFAHPRPYRIERGDRYVESIRTFDPDSQLSVDKVDKAQLAPDMQTRITRERRAPFTSFMDHTTNVWIKDVEALAEELNTNRQKATERFDALSTQAGGAAVALPPDQLFADGDEMARHLEAFTRIEFGARYRLSADEVVEWPSAAPMSFNKNFNMLAERLGDAPLQGYTCFIAAENPTQLDRFRTILEEISPEAAFTPLPFALRAGFVDKRLFISLYTDHQLMGRFHQRRHKAPKHKALTLKGLKSLQSGDFVTHIDYGIGKFAGLEKREVNGVTQERIRIVFRDDDVLYAGIHTFHKIAKYTGREGNAPPVSKLGSKEWDNKKAKVKSRLKDIAKELIGLYARRRQAPGHAFRADGLIQAELESSFIYVDTPDQVAATEQVKRDMEAPHPMDRLICGDVGFGKTEIAIRAACKAVNEGKQVAVLVPTTILALQHYRTFQGRLADFPIRVEYLSRFKSAKEAQTIMQDVAQGAVDIVIGTHRLTNKKLVFKDLGLLVIDEEQKFGVGAKEKIKKLKVNVDVLTLTATPIPRTLHFSLMGARDLSVLNTPPPNRQAVSTELHTYHEEIIRDAIRFELQRKGQVFFVHNRVGDIEGIANIILKLAPDAKIGIAHGQMEGSRLERTMIRFIRGEYDVLVSTNIIESGLDIPNANTVIVNQAHTFGLSDLHQIRGRVGRSNKKAFCYFLTPPLAKLAADARKRLEALTEFSELGDGIKVAMRDLEIRGAGNILGAEQTGFINDLGFDAYHNILDNAVKELKEDEFKELFADEVHALKSRHTLDCTIETDLEILIPETYVPSSSERLRLYSELNGLNEESELELFKQRLIDRFGPVPEPASQLIRSMQIKWMGGHVGAEKITLKSSRIKIYFPAAEEAHFAGEPFAHILAFIQAHASRCSLRQKGKKHILEIADVSTVEEALKLLAALQPPNSTHTSTTLQRDKAITNRA